MKPKN